MRLMNIMSGAMTRFYRIKSLKEIEMQIESFVP